MTIMHIVYKDKDHVAKCGKELSPETRYITDGSPEPVDVPKCVPCLIVDKKDKEIKQLKRTTKMVDD